NLPWNTRWPRARSSRPLLPRLMAEAFTSRGGWLVQRLALSPLALERESPSPCRGEGIRAARCQPGPREGRATWAKGSERSDHCARHRLSPPVIVVSSSISDLGSSARKRDGMLLVHWP